MAGELQAIEELLRNEIGLDPTSVGHQFILRAARLRMSDLKLSSLAAYEQKLKQSATELEELIEEVIVSESWFFRDERPFDWLRDHVREKWIATPGRSVLRILSLPCAAGEEPYSIAIVLREVGLPARRYHIDGVDLSARRLANARRGVYSKNAFRGPDAPYRTRYFRQHPEGYEIVRELRTSVHFSQGSILDSRLLAGFPPYDVVFCRNLLIYLAPQARDALLDRINKLLAPDGFLVIGHTDSLASPRAGKGFVATGDLGCFAYRRIACDEQGVVPTPVLLETPGPYSSLLSTAPSGQVEPSRSHEPTQSGFPTARPVTAEGLITRKPEVSLQLLEVSELANQKRFVEAIALCQRCLRETGPSAPVYSVMGMICQAAGDRGRAEDCFRRAVYLDPNHDEALLALALMAEHRGDNNAANGFRRRAERTATLAQKRVN
jgi:chemotaxis protein methyltransferase WspC